MLRLLSGQGRRLVPIDLPRGVVKRSVVKISLTKALYHNQNNIDEAGSQYESFSDRRWINPR
jgi:hypothetical protein